VKQQFLIVLAVVLPLAAQTAAPKKVAAKAAAAKNRAALRTPWGDPDLQGVWNDATSTPLQRPNGLAEKDVLNDDEAAEFRAQLARELTRDRVMAERKWTSTGLITITGWIRGG
jgi:hypothetical protein